MSLVKWDFDHAHSSVDFTVRHMLVSKVRGRFTKWTGHLELDEQNVAHSRVDVEIARTGSSARNNTASPVESPVTTFKQWCMP